MKYSGCGDKITRIKSVYYDDNGSEGLFISGTANMTAKVTRVNKNTFRFSYLVWGRPDILAEPSFQYILPRESVNIWHAVSGSFSATDQGVDKSASLSGSRFPSHALWMDGKEIERIEQGAFGDLWRSDRAGLHAAHAGLCFHPA